MTAREFGASLVELMEASKSISPSAEAIIENAQHLLRRWSAEFLKSAQVELMAALEEWRRGCSEPHYNDADHLNAAYLSRSPGMTALVEKISERYPAAKPLPEGGKQIGLYV